MELLPKDERTALLMFHIHVALLRKKHGGGAAKDENVGGNWLDYVSFAVQGNGLQAELDPTWSPAAA